MGFRQAMGARDPAPAQVAGSNPYCCADHAFSRPALPCLSASFMMVRTTHLLQQAMHYPTGLGRDTLGRQICSIGDRCMPQLHHLHAPPAGVVRRLSDNGALSPAGSIDASIHGMPDGISDADRKQRELYTRQQQLLREQRTADQEKLLATISGEANMFWI